MATISVTKSGTLNPTLSRIDNDDATTTAYVAGDTLSVSNNAQLKINTSTAASLPGPLLATSSSKGTFYVENTSTTVPIVVSLKLQTSDISTTGNSNFKVRGNWIVVATGNGAAAQTIDFSTIGGVSIDYPPCVWVETADSRHYSLTIAGTPGYFMPFFNCGEVADTAAINILTHFYGDLDHGPVFQFDRTTKLATFGKGGAIGSSLGGAVIPNGARVLYPNIHFTSDTFDSTESARNELRPSNGGNVDMQICAFSRNWTLGRGTNTWFAGGSSDLRHVGTCCRFFISFSIGPTYVDNLAVGPDPSQSGASINLQITGCSSTVEIGTLWQLNKTSVSSSGAMQIDTLPMLTSVGKLFSWHFNTASSANTYAVLFSQIASDVDIPISVGRVHAVGGRLLTQDILNTHVARLDHSDQCQGVAQTSQTTTALTLTNSNDGVTVAQVRKLTNGVAPRGQLISRGVKIKKCTIKDVDYDAQSNAAEIDRLSGTRSYLSNTYVPNIRTALLTDSKTNIELGRTSNVYGNQAATVALGNLQQGTFHEWAMGTTSSWTATGGSVDGNPFNTFWTANDKSTGQIRLGPFRSDVNEEHLTVVSGTEGTDWLINSASSLVWLEGNGVELIYTTSYPIRGITNFTSATWNATTTNYTSVSTEFSLKIPETDTWGSWYDATTAANWQTALAALSGYSSTTGFDLRIRIVTTAAVSGRYFQYARISCTPDAAWTPAEIGFVPIDVTQAVAGTYAKLYVNTVPASPVAVTWRQITGTEFEFDFPYDFDAVAKAYKFKIRKAGYGELSLTGSTYQMGRTVPISQVQAVVVDPVVAAAITGISINGATNTVTVSTSNTISDIYAYCQWWSTQRANYEYDIPLVTTNGTTYTSTFNFTVNASVAITGSGSVSLGSAALTMGSGASSTIDWAYSTTKTWTRLNITGLTAGSRVRVYNSTGAVEWYNAVVAATSLEIQKEYTASQTLDVRVTYVSGVTAKLPWQQPSIFGASGGSVLAAQEADAVYNTNAINGSLVTEFSADYPNVQIDVSDGDGTTTVQRIYAWFAYTLTTATGIVDFFGGLTAVDAANYEIDQSVVNLLVQNVSATACVLTGARLYRSDGTTIFIAGTGPIQHDPAKAYIAQDLLPGTTDAIWSDSKALTVGKFLGLK